MAISMLEKQSRRSIEAAWVSGHELPMPSLDVSRPMTYDDLRVFDKLSLGTQDAVSLTACLGATAPSSQWAAARASRGRQLQSVRVHVVRWHFDKAFVVGFKSRLLASSKSAGLRSDRHADSQHEKTGCLKRASRMFCGRFRRNWES